MRIAEPYVFERARESATRVRRRASSVDDDAARADAAPQAVERILELVERDLRLDQALDRQPALDVQAREPGKSRCGTVEP